MLALLTRWTRSLYLATIWRQRSNTCGQRTSDFSAHGGICSRNSASLRQKRMTRCCNLRPRFGDSRCHRLAARRQVNGMWCPFQRTPTICPLHRLLPPDACLLLLPQLLLKSWWEATLVPGLWVARLPPQSVVRLICSSPTLTTPLHRWNKLIHLRPCLLASNKGNLRPSHRVMMRKRR